MIAATTPVNSFVNKLVAARVDLVGAQGPIAEPADRHAALAHVQAAASSISLALSTTPADAPAASVAYSATAATQARQAADTIARGDMSLDLRTQLASGSIASALGNLDTALAALGVDAADIIYDAS